MSSHFLSRPIGRRIICRGRQAPELAPPPTPLQALGPTHHLPGSPGPGTRPAEAPLQAHGPTHHLPGAVRPRNQPLPQSLSGPWAGTSPAGVVRPRNQAQRPLPLQALGPAQSMPGSLGPGTRPSPNPFQALGPTRPRHNRSLSQNLCQPCGPETYCGSTIPVAHATGTRSVDPAGLNPQPATRLRFHRSAERSTTLSTCCLPAATVPRPPSPVHPSPSPNNHHPSPNPDRQGSGWAHLDHPEPRLLCSPERQDIAPLSL